MSIYVHIIFPKAVPFNVSDRAGNKIEGEFTRISLCKSSLKNINNSFFLTGCVCMTNNCRAM